MTPDEIGEANPRLGLAEVHAALAYYYDHHDLICSDWANAESLVAELQKRYPSQLVEQRK